MKNSESESLILIKIGKRSIKEALKEFMFMLHHFWKFFFPPLLSYLPRDKVNI
jgi:hypothetical protein